MTVLKPLQQLNKRFGNNLISTKKVKPMKGSTARFFGVVKHSNTHSVLNSMVHSAVLSYSSIVGELVSRLLDLIFDRPDRNQVKIEEKDILLKSIRSVELKTDGTPKYANTAHPIMTVQFKQPKPEQPIEIYLLVFGQQKPVTESGEELKAKLFYEKNKKVHSMNLTEAEYNAFLTTCKSVDTPGINTPEKKSREEANGGQYKACLSPNDVPEARNLFQEFCNDEKDEVSVIMPRNNQNAAADMRSEIVWLNNFQAYLRKFGAIGDELLKCLSFPKYTGETKTHYNPWMMVLKLTSLDEALNNTQITTDAARNLFFQLVKFQVLCYFCKVIHGDPHSQNMAIKNNQLQIYDFGKSRFGNLTDEQRLEDIKYFFFKEASKLGDSVNRKFREVTGYDPKNRNAKHYPLHRLLVYIRPDIAEEDIAAKLKDVGAQLIKMLRNNNNQSVDDICKTIYQELDGWINTQTQGSESIHPQSDELEFSHTEGSMPSLAADSKTPTHTDPLLTQEKNITTPVTSQRQEKRTFGSMIDLNVNVRGKQQQVVDNSDLLRV